MASMTGGMSPAGAQLGLLGGSSLADMAGGPAGETDEERRKRLLAQNAAKLLPNTGMSAAARALGLGYGSAVGSGF